jgi:hypothetical protein
MGGINYWTLSLSDEWYTPKYIFDDLKVEFDMDVCSPGKGKAYTPAKHHVTLPQENGLEIDWKGFIWCNPPYGKKNQDWYKKFYDHGNGLAFLTLAQMPTSKFVSLLGKIDAILIYHKRVHLIDGTTGKRKNSPGGSMLVAMGEKALEAIKNTRLGTVWYYG